MIIVLRHVNGNALLYDKKSRNCLLNNSRSELYIVKVISHILNQQAQLNLTRFRLNDQGSHF